MLTHTQTERERESGEKVKREERKRKKKKREKVDGTTEIEKFKTMFIYLNDTQLKY
jgi:hypothetical protein